MKHMVRIKTGFYETTLYHLIIDSDSIQLIPTGDLTKSPIMIKTVDLQSISLLRCKDLKIEIISNQNLIQGIFEDNTNDKNILEDLRHNLKTKIRYEEGYNEK